MEKEENIEYHILNRLKKKLITVRDLPEECFGSKRWNGKSDKSQFYLFNANNNLFEAPNNGIRLGTGVDAIRSSAAMIFNLLGQEDVYFNETKYSIEYEEKYVAIKDENNESHNAHLDAVLKKNEESNIKIIAIEAKMLEWLNSPKNLAQVYLKEEYYPEENNQKRLFVDFFNDLVNTNKVLKDGRYAKKEYKRYDAIQMTIHILSLYNYCCRDGNRPMEITLYNVVWSYNCPEYCIEKKEANDFIERANKKFKPIFKDKGVDFEAKYIEFDSFKKMINLSKDRERYLERYNLSC